MVNCTKDDDHEQIFDVKLNVAISNGSAKKSLRVLRSSFRFPPKAETLVAKNMTAFSSKKRSGKTPSLGQRSKCTLKRPSFSRGQIKSRPLNGKCTEWTPIRLQDIKLFHRFQDKLIIDQSYTTMIRLAHEHLPCDSDTNAMDISIHFNLLPKNVAHESLRFAAIGDVNCTLNQQDTSIFNSTDIDMFFLRLGALDSSSESVKATFRRQIPLA